MTQLTIKQWISEAIKSYQTNDLPRLDAEVWASFTLNKTKSWIISHPEYVISPKQIIRLNAGWEKIRKGFPLPYMLGEWEFYGFKFIVDQNVLIPRPETELLVDFAINWLKQNNDVNWFLDVGTGSGCIAISILNHVHQVKAIATERYWGTLKNAQRNVSRFKLGKRILLVNTDLTNGITSRCRLICANLPYIPSAHIHNLRVAQCEPINALDGGDNGLHYIYGLLAQLRNKLSRDTLILLEIDPEQEELIRQCTSSLYHQPGIEMIRDLNGLQRIMAISIN